MGQQTINGLTLGAMLALIALGYTMVYGILELINFAHGEVFMCGSFLGLFFLEKLMQAGFSALMAFLPALLLAMMATALLGLGIERLAYRPLRGAPRLSLLISAIGASLFLMNFVMLFVANDAKTYPPLFDVTYTLASLRLRQADIVVIGVTALALTGLMTLIYGTRLGRAMRCIAQDRDAARLVGIPVDQVIAATFCVGSALAACGGLLFGVTNHTIRFDMGFVMGIKAFTAAVLGGVGNVKGAVLGGLLLGLFETLVVGALDWVLRRNFGITEAFNYKDAVSFSILVAVLMFMPSGILGENIQQKA